MGSIVDQTMTESRRSVALRSTNGVRATVDQGTGPVGKELRGRRRQDRRP